MQLVTTGLRSRSFILQWFQIMGEFGEEIPWLNPLKSYTHSTNATYFRDRLLLGLGCKEPNDVTAFQFVSSDRAREYVGGILFFAHSPERFVDRTNQGLAELLTHEQYRFVSCLQVRDVHRGKGHGNALMRRALRTTLNAHPRVYGVVSNPRLLPWYASLGATVRSPLENKDKLWIISWEQGEI